MLRRAEAHMAWILLHENSGVVPELSILDPMEIPAVVRGSNSMFLGEVVRNQMCSCREEKSIEVAQGTCASGGLGNLVEVECQGSESRRRCHPHSRGFSPSPSQTSSNSMIPTTHSRGWIVLRAPTLTVSISLISVLPPSLRVTIFTNTPARPGPILILRSASTPPATPFHTIRFCRHLQSYNWSPYGNGQILSQLPAIQFDEAGTAPPPPGVWWGG